jgi:hypothetical protein
MVAFSSYKLIQERLEDLAGSWKEAGSQLSFDVSQNYGRCAVEGCNIMAFVGLRTQRGPRPVCLNHYQVLDAPWRT